ncbi:MAG: dihydrolipoamide acetyltransferase family protein [Candidatus Bathyarchaeia archaeon]
MVTEVIMPKMGQTMEKGRIIRWLKKEGEVVQRGEPLLEIETDKTTIEVEARGAGILRKIVAQEGEEAPIGKIIGYIAREDEPLPEEPQIIAETPAKKTTEKISTEPAKPPEGPEVAEKVKASPLAKKLAEELGININEVVGTGPGGRITREDVLAFAAKKQKVVAEEAAEFQVVPLTSMRKAIASKMVQSKTSAPHFYVSTQVDMTEAVRLRETLLPTYETETGARLSFTHMLVKAVALALAEFPRLNSTFEDENIRQWTSVNIGIAVSLEDGLIVPVLRNADKLSLKEIVVKTTDLVARAREKKLREEEFSGGTFTISNMGQFDVDSFVAIINVPETAILATGRINDRVVVVNGGIVVRKMMTVTLSADHRVVDGAYAAKFLQKVKNLLESPNNLI